MIAWLEIQEAFALIAIAGTIASVWLSEKREARAEARREEKLRDLEKEFERTERQIDGFLSQIADLEVRIIQLEKL